MCGDKFSGKLSALFRAVVCVALFIVSSMFLFAFCGRRGEECVNMNVETVDDRMVRIVCGNKSGSGVIYETSADEIIIVTAAHVVEGQENAEVIFAGQEKFSQADRENGEGIVKGKMVKEESDEDTVVKAAKAKEENVKKAKEESVRAATGEIVIVSGLDLAFLRLQGNVAWNMADNEENENDVLTILGYDGDGKWQEASAEILYEWIYLEDFQSHMMLVKAETKAGMSGGGLFGSNGEFVGILCGKDAQEQAAVLPAQVIAAEYTVYAQRAGDL